jgi:signal transduction histidine kinase/ActR/RegA family two-component response regulator/HAMP domain-containing protein
VPTTVLGSIRIRLAALIFALVAVMIGAGIAASYYEIRRSALAIASERLVALTTQLGPIIATSPTRSRNAVRTLARDPSVIEALRSSDPITRAVAGATLSRALGPSIVAELRDSAGVLVASTNGANPASAAVPNLGAAADTVTPLHWQNDSLFFSAVARVMHEDRLVGYLSLRQRIQTDAQQRSSLSALVGSQANILLGNATGGAWTDMERQVPGPPLDPATITGVVSYPARDGTMELAAATPVPGTPWTLVIEFPREPVLAPARTALTRLSVLGILVLGISLIFAWGISQSLTSPIQRLADTASAIGTGDFSKRVSSGRVDEIGVLERSFDHMAVTLAEGRRQLREDARVLEEQNATLARVSAELDAALAGAPVAIASYDTELRVGRVNARFAELTGLGAEAHIGRPVAEVAPGLARAAEAHFRHVLQTSESVAGIEIVAAMPAEPEKERDWLASFYPIRTAGGELIGAGSVLLDLTDYRALERQLLQAQKMEAVGRLAGGVAHDFNNILTAISNFTQFAIASLPDGSPARRDIEQVQEAAARATTLTRQLLAFSRQQVMLPRVIDVNSVVREIEPMMRRLIGADVELRTTLDDALWSVKADPGQLEQVLVNLVVNARDAMPNGGAITIATGRVILDEEYVRDGHPGASVGPHVLLAVSDTGSGMDADTRGRIFEPFFTTKGPGRGTGLGLSMVYGIVKQTGGSIWVYSEPGHGTTFKIYLPRHVGTAESVPRYEVPSVGNAPPSTILLVEDDAQVRLVSRRTLERFGHTVIEARDGRHALDVLAVLPRETQIDLVVSDLVMPEIGGRELVSRLRADGRDTRVLFMSGYALDAVNRQLMLDPRDAFLEKPFTPDQLARRVHEVLAVAAAE